MTMKKLDDGISARMGQAMRMPAKPFVKWAGGKSKLLCDIRSKYPAGLGNEIKKYAEPFAGGGAVLFDILSSYRMDEIYISDINRELIHAYIAIRDNVIELAASLRVLEESYTGADGGARKEIYKSARRRYNELKTNGGGTAEAASLFIFLNKTCYNGLYRVNSRGAFNVPQGNYIKPKICDERNLHAVSEKLQKVSIVCAGYKESRQFIDSKTFAYFDPPYRPLSATANFTSYGEDSFGDNEQAELAAFIGEMAKKGARIAASNSDPKNTDAGDFFFDRLYAGYNISTIYASRSINSVGSSRGAVSELLITNY